MFFVHPTCFIHSCLRNCTARHCTTPLAGTHRAGYRVPPVRHRKGGDRVVNPKTCQPCRTFGLWNCFINHVLEHPCRV